MNGYSSMDIITKQCLKHVAVTAATKIQVDGCMLPEMAGRLAGLIQVVTDTDHSLISVIKEYMSKYIHVCANVKTTSFCTHLFSRVRQFNQKKKKEEKNNNNSFSKELHLASPYIQNLTKPTTQNTPIHI